VPWGGIVLGVLSLPGALWVLVVMALMSLSYQSALSVVLLPGPVVPVASVVMAIVGGSTRKRKLQEAGMAGLIALTIFWPMFAIWAYTDSKSRGSTLGFFGNFVALLGLAQFVLTGLAAFLLRKPGWARED
jgi:hypothetical protein